MRTRWDIAHDSGCHGRPIRRIACRHVVSRFRRAPQPAAPTSLLKYPSFVRLWFTRTATTGAFHMQGVAVGWQLYEMTGNPIDLGIVGLIQFLPLVVLNLVVGQVTDRYDRRAIIR